MKCECGHEVEEEDMSFFVKNSHCPGCTRVCKWGQDEKGKFYRMEEGRKYVGRKRVKALRRGPKDYYDFIGSEDDERKKDNV